MGEEETERKLRVQGRKGKGQQGRTEKTIVNKRKEARYRGKRTLKSTRMNKQIEAIR